jgi:hypothetical protein
MTEKIDIDESKLGGNKATAPAEDGEEQEDTTVDAAVVTGINVVITGRLQETSYDKKSFTAWFKDYSKTLVARLQDRNPARVDKFKTGVTELYKKVAATFNEWRFFTGVSAFVSVGQDCLTVLMNSLGSRSVEHEPRGYAYSPELP